MGGQAPQPRASGVILLREEQKLNPFQCKIITPTSRPFQLPLSHVALSQLQTLEKSVQNIQTCNEVDRWEGVWGQEDTLHRRFTRSYIKPLLHPTHSLNYGVPNVSQSRKCSSSWCYRIG